MLERCGTVGLVLRDSCKTRCIAAWAFFWRVFGAALYAVARLASTVMVALLGAIVIPLHYDTSLVKSLETGSGLSRPGIVDTVLPSCGILHTAPYRSRHHVARIMGRVLLLVKDT